MQDTTYLVLVVEGARRTEPCPRPWRPRRGAVQDDEIVVQCSRTGHDPDDLAAWLHHELGLGSEPGAKRAGQPFQVLPPWRRLT